MRRLAVGPLWSGIAWCATSALWVGTRRLDTGEPILLAQVWRVAFGVAWMKW
jgi:hypothetical protein